MPDQLRLAQGWVRCGRCDEVFLASRHLLEGPWEQAGQTNWAQEPAADRLGDEAPPPTEADFPPLGGAPTEHPPEATATAQAHRDRTAQASSTSLEAGEAPMDPTDASPIGATTDHAETPPLDEPQAAWQASTAAAAASTSTHPYSWERARRARPQRSGAARAAWAGVLALALVGLGAQSLHAWRDHLAAALPAARPVLQIWCALASCRIEPLRRIGALSVESSQLRQMGGTIYRLDVVIRNRADLPLMMPSLDLALTDARGQLLARKALELSDFGVRSRVLGAGQELAILASVNAGTTEVAGYTIEIFHP